MQSFWPSKDEFFGHPRRVSRLFVILFIFSATLNALLGITYGYLQITHTRITEQQDAVIQSTLKQATGYKNERDDAQATVAEKNIELDGLNKELAAKNKELTNLEKQLNSLASKINTQEVQLAANSSELESLRSRPPLFSFQRNTSRNVSQDETEVREIVTAAYDVIKEVYGAPYILHQITINFVDALSISGASGEISISNSSSGLDITIRMTSFDKDSYENVNTIVHEIIHGFHGLSALSEPIMEEGIAVAATDVVMRKLYEKGTINFNQDYVIISDEQAGQLNSSLSSPPNSSALYSSPYVASYYQLAGWAWTKIYEADSSFFAKFNNSLYGRVIDGTSASKELSRSIIKQLVGTINGQSSADFLASQIIFN